MISNTEKTLKNSFVSVIAQAVLLILQFVNRKVFINFLDIEYLGYQTLFGNVFSILSIAELGIGNIIAFHLYKEIVDSNEEEIGKLMHLYKWLYRIVALLVAIGGMICYFLLPFFVKDAQASWNYLHLIYFLQLFGVVAGYFLSYRRTIYIAMQREYECIKIDLYTSIVIQIVQLTLLAIFKNYILYLILQLSINIIANYLIAKKADREFSYLNKKYVVTKEDIQKRNMFSDLKNFLVHQISYAIYGGTDNIIISAICGIKEVALFGNYVMIQKGVMQLFFYKLLNPLQATLGNIVYSERSKNELWKQFKMLDVFSFYFASYIGLGFLIFYQPFITIWLGEQYLLSNTFVVLLSVTIYLGAVWEIVYKYRTVFGDYRQDRNYMIISAVLNLLISIVGAKTIGIEGVQFGTLIAYLPIAYGRIRYVVKQYFQKSILQYYLKHVCLFMVVFVEGVICYVVCNKIPISIVGFLLRIIMWLIITQLATIFYHNDESFKELLMHLNNIRNVVINKAKKGDK